ncbi:DUF802 domain-containing protein [Azoarcus sp. DD4]|uniref:DUF802 domain-containing protein n=1 Tax=Azoarcus sp. DD4 TaxID=2027405 RepID=UPI0011294562|nr:DUF802 domain-containing protein [Azoarcus sp. DD4]QDF95367.1 DUF802 domain-containing protein [Azoarcus sp. DD4]
MNRIICVAAFVVGLVVVSWVGAGYIGASPLALTMTALIGAVYLAGALELQRFHRATAALAQALAAIPADLAHPGEWLAKLPPSLQNPVRLRIEGERVGLPGPAMTPYLVGLLVLLGMLGTFLGMVVTLKGAVLALESTTDLQTIRAALAAPVKGLGVAFGTSVAGVAASAMLGLISALCRRARLQTAQLLDDKIATALRGFSLAHQRQQTFKAVQAQSEVLPQLVDKLQAMMAQMERSSSQANDRLLAEQERFYREAKGMYAELAASVDSSLKDSLTASARLAGATIQPVVEATMAGIARETTALQARVADSVQTQLDGLAERFDGTVTTVTQGWTAALAEHQRSSAALNDGLQTSLAAFAATFEQRSAALLASVEGSHAGLRATLAATTGELAQETGALHARLANTVEAQLDGIATRFDNTVTTVADTWTTALARHERSSEAVSGKLEGSLQAFVDTFEQRSAALLASVEGSHAGLRAELAAATRGLAQETGALHARLGETVETQLDGLAERFGTAVSTVADHWTTALARHERSSEALSGQLHSALQAFADTFAQRSAALLATVGDSVAALQAELAARDTARLAAQTEALENMVATLQQEWQQAGAHTLAQQAQICQTLGDTARDIAAEARTQASGTIAEVTRLMQTAAEAPKAAADVIGELRKELSASIARDNDMLVERSRIMETLAALLDAINHASTEQRGAIDALVASSAAALEHAGSRFTDSIEAESSRMTELAGQISGGAAEVASLGEAFGAAVQLFSDSNDKLMTTLQRIEGSLDKSMARSDEQLAYYVAQAREIIDLSIMSQKQIVEDLQRMSGKQATLAGGV